MWHKVGWVVGGIWAIVVIVPTAMSWGRGLTLAVGQGTRGFGMVMDDTVSLIMFWVSVVLVGSVLIALIVTTVYKKITAQGKPNNSKVKTMAINKGQRSELSNKGCTQIAILGIAIIAMVVIVANKKQGTTIKTPR